MIPVSFKSRQHRVVAASFTLLPLLLACGLRAEDPPSDPRASRDTRFPCSLTVKSSPFDNVFFPDEEKKLTAEIENHTPAAREVTLSVEITTEDGKKSHIDRKLSLPASASQKVEVPVDLPTPGFAECAFSLASDALECRTTVSVVLPPSLKSVAFDHAFYGICTMSNPATAYRMGARFIRNFIYWRWTNREPGVFDFSSYIDFGRLCHDAGVGVIYTFEPEPPAWTKASNMAAVGQSAALEDFKNWVREGVKALPPGQFGVEINNEPDITIGRRSSLNEEDAARSTANLLKAGYEVVKGIDPNIPVIGAGVSGNGAAVLTFANDVLKDADGRIDYYSPHPYPGTQYITPDGSVSWPDQFLAPLLEKNVKLAEEFTRKKELWSTELGWAYPMKETYLSAAARDYAAICGQTLVLFKTVPRVGKITWFRGFQWQDGLNERGYDYSLFTRSPGGLRPTAAVNAFATVSSLLEGSETGRKLQTGLALQAYLFKNSATGKAIVALWSANYNVTFNGSLPEGIHLVDLYGRTRSRDESSCLLTRAPSFLVADLASADMLRNFVEKSAWRPERPFIVKFLGATNDKNLRLVVDNMLPTAAEVEIAIPSSSAKATLAPGENTVALTMSGSEFGAASAQMPVKIHGAEVNIETRLDKELVQTPYFKSGSLRVDGSLSKQKEAIASHQLITRGAISPPDPSIPWSGPTDLSVKYGYAWNEEGLYLLAIAEDDRMTSAPDNGKGFWNFDSFQAAFDPQTNGGMSGYQLGQREIGLFLNAAGESQLIQTYPPKDGPPRLEAKSSRQGTKTIYELFLPWPYLYADNFKPSAGAILASNFVVNDNDGGSRKCWIGPTEGIGSGKQPGRFPWLHLLAPDASR